MVSQVAVKTRAPELLEPQFESEEQIKGLEDGMNEHAPAQVNAGMDIGGGNSDQV